MRQFIEHKRHAGRSLVDQIWSPVTVGGRGRPLASHPYTKLATEASGLLFVTSIV
jgi:hypothetical protein